MSAKILSSTPYVLYEVATNCQISLSTIAVLRPIHTCRVFLAAQLPRTIYGKRFFPTSPATRFLNDAAKLKYFSFSASCRTITIDKSIMFRGHIGCQTSYQSKMDRIVEEIPVHVRMTQKDKVIGDDSIRIHQNNAIGFFVKVNVNRLWMIFVACFIGYLF